MSKNGMFKAQKKGFVGDVMEKGVAVFKRILHSEQNLANDFQKNRVGKKSLIFV